MEFSQIKTILAEEAKALGITEYDIYFSRSAGLSAETLKNEINSFSDSNNIGVCFRCIRDGKFGYASGELIREDELRALVSRAYENALYVEGDETAEEAEDETVEPMADMQSPVIILHTDSNGYASSYPISVYVDLYFKGSGYQGYTTVTAYSDGTMAVTLPGQVDVSDTSARYDSMINVYKPNGYPDNTWAKWTTATG